MAHYHLLQKLATCIASFVGMGSASAHFELIINCSDEIVIPVFQGKSMPILFQTSETGIGYVTLLLVYQTFTWIVDKFHNALPAIKQKQAW